MISWREVKLEDICEITSSKRIFMADYVDSGIPFYRSKEIIEKQRGNNISTELFITEEKYEEIKQKFSVPQEGDILLTSVGTLGIPYIVRENEKFYFKDGNLTWIKKSKNFLPEYLYYYLISDEGKFKLENISIGTTQKAITIVGLKGLEISLPPLDIQKKIAGVLGALDDKIELNNKINNNLEQQAQALFKSWFVDFEPFGGKMPKDWKESDIYSISNIIYGAPFASKLFNTEKKGLPIIRIRDLKNQHSDTYTEEIHPKAYIIKAGDIVVGMDGEFRPYIWGNDEGLLNQRVCVFENKRSLGKMFLYLTIKPLLNRVEQTEVATTVIHIGKQDFDAFRFSMPSNSILDKFDAVTQPIYNKIVSNSLENTRLASLRDALLPKLMSGKIDVSKVDISALTSADKLSFRK